MARRQDPTRFDAFTGINNRDREPLPFSNVLRDGVDVDITKRGKVQTRPGYTAPLVACDLGHSLWADPEGLFPFGLYADGAELRTWTADLRTELLFDNLSVGLEVSYCRINDSVYWSNGVESGMVDAIGDAAPWSPASPGGQPMLQAIDGALGAGQVQAAVTFVDRRGRESGAALARAITIDAGQGVQLYNIPQPPDPVETPVVRLYVTGGNDRGLYRARDIAAGVTSVPITQPPDGKLLATQFLTAMPPGHIVRHWNGRQLVARGRFVLWSPSLRYGMTHIGHMHLGLRGKLTLMEPIEGDGAGVFVSDGSRVLFLSGADPKGWSPRPVSAYGAVPGSAMLTPASAWGIESKRWLPAWLGKDGLFAVGMPGGTVATFAQEEFAADVGDSAASLFRESDGLMQFITAMRGARKSRLAVTDTVVTRVFREDGTRLS